MTYEGVRTYEYNTFYFLLYLGILVHQEQEEYSSSRNHRRIIYKACEDDEDVLMLRAMPTTNITRTISTVFRPSLTTSNEVSRDSESTDDSVQLAVL